MPDPAPQLDPPPRPPRPPEPGECCHGGCARCVFDIHADAVELYEAQLREWRARHGGDTTPIRPDGPR